MPQLGSGFVVLIVQQFEAIAPSSITRLSPSIVTIVPPLTIVSAFSFFPVCARAAIAAKLSTVKTSNETAAVCTLLVLRVILRFLFERDLNFPRC